MTEQEFGAWCAQNESNICQATTRRGVRDLIYRFGVENGLVKVAEKVVKKAPQKAKAAAAKAEAKSD